MQSAVRWAGKLVTCGTVGNLPFVCACRFPSTNTCKREVTHTLSTFTNTFLHGYVVWVRRARWGKATHNFMAARTVNLPLQQIQVVGRGQNGHGHVLKQDSNRSQQHSFVRRRAVGIFHVSARVEPELVMLEMSNPLQDDLIAFNSTAEANSSEITKEAIAEESDAHASEPNELTPSSTEVSVCEICNRQFLKKKDLRSHFLVHVGQPRVVLNRIPNRKPAKKHVTDTYRLDPEKKGSLKLTLKKQGSTDSLKLTLKKSSISQDFAVVNTNLDSENYQRNDVAGSGTNDSKDTSNTENDADEPFENVMINQQNYENNDYKTDERTDPLQDRDRPPFMDINEGDSGVGSDTVNAPEREDQAIEDQPSIDGLDNSEKVLPEIDDHEESDAIEATCREAIENLKKLGEDTRTVDPLADTGLPIEANTDETTAMIQQLTENSSISIIPKSSICPIPSPKPNSAHEVQGEASQSPKSNPDFNWNELSSDLSNRNTENTDKQGEQTVDQADPHTGSLLQNFLMEHHRRNENETSLSSNLPPGETEYVSLERLAETVSTCRVCNEKFPDITQLDVHKTNAGHFQCNIPDCVNLIFNSLREVSVHKAQAHGAPISPNLNQLSPHVNTSSPHGGSLGSTHSSNSPQLSRTSPLRSPHQTGTPPFISGNKNQRLSPPVNFDQLPAPVQQLAQQVQRMPLPQPQLPPSLPPGVNTLIPGPHYYQSRGGRPPMYNMPGPPQQMHFPPHLSHLYPPYNTAAYQHMSGAPPLMSQMPHQMSRGRYPAPHNLRAPRIPSQAGPVPRQRLKRSAQLVAPPQLQQTHAASKQRRMDVLVPDRNEDADCHIIAQQKRNDGLPVIQSVQGAVQPSVRNDSTIHLTDSITLSVRQPAQTGNSSSPTGKKSDAKAVANVLAARGITVTPAASKNKSSEQGKQLPQPQLRAPPSPSQAVNVTSLNLNSAISIIPATSQRKQQEQQGQFAVPQTRPSKQLTSDVDRPPRPPTVDLTQDTPQPLHHMTRRGRPSKAMLTCQVCDKIFQNQEMLTQHMATHQTPSKLLHKCHQCPAQYPTAQALAQHIQTYHKETETMLQNGGAELALPVVDLKSHQVLNRLSSLGIQSYIPLSQLSAQTGGYFGLPIVTRDGVRNSSICNLAALGANSVLSLGPLKYLPPR
ncbi:uncharacterized protein LOC124179162 isoform X1 [Neodiprion fabricii]|uniref:uncharacterized protein LOC124179162 isoform X1 n=1 Tax=Neodiprion fabricii TaxID=2872261 RepID=UPI001ED96791|nr:uncharacterized protein LOC124179162 isoform X1 [Neodiprion fabricii]